MTDKEKIIVEIERRINFLDGMINTDFGRGSLDTLNKVLNFINSLPAEQPSEELEEEIKRKYESDNALMMPIKDFRKLILHFTNWQKEQMMKGLCYETKVYRDEEGDGIDTPIESWLALENNEITNLPNIGLKDGDNVKVIIAKEAPNDTTEKN